MVMLLIMVMSVMLRSLMMLKPMSRSMSVAGAWVTSRGARRKTAGGGGAVLDAELRDHDVRIARSSRQPLKAGEPRLGVTELGPEQFFHLRDREYRQHLCVTISVSALPLTIRGALVRRTRVGECRLARMPKSVKVVSGVADLRT
jgi:hypothetical protein